MHLFLKKIYRKNPFPKIYRINQCEVLILKQKGAIVDFFKYLSKHFNGEIFSFSKEENDILANKDLSRFAYFFDKKMEGKSRQLVFWDLYSFEDLPVELISNVYEEFLEKKRGIVYTPPYLVNFLLDESIPFSNTQTDFKVLDPACGSGIFLVGAYKRLVYRWRAKNNWRKPSILILQQLLKENIFGVDKEPEAINLAAFSLSLALCDELSPLIIWDYLKFDNLKNENLFDSDFFELIKNEKLKPNFNLVIGNPPFDANFTKSAQEIEDKRKTERIIEWEGQNEKIGIPGKQIALLFLDQAIKLCKEEDSLLCLILPASDFLYNYNADKYRTWFFQNHHTFQVIDFTNLSGCLFGSANVSVAALFAKNHLPENIEEVNHITVRRNYIAEEKLFFELDYYDFHKVSYDESLSKNFVWKANLFGGGRLIRLLTKLYKIKETIGSYLKIKKKEDGWGYGEGFTIGNREKIEILEKYYQNELSEEEIGSDFLRYLKKTFKEANWITGKDYIKNQSFTSKGLNTNEIKKVDNKYFYRNCESKKQIFQSPHILIKETISNHQISSVFTDQYLTFDDRIIGIHAPSNQIQDLKILFNTLKNNLTYVFYTALTSSEFAISQNNTTAIQKKDIDNLPYPADNLEKLKLSKTEIIIRDDTINYWLEYATGKKKNLALFQNVTKKDLERFGGTYCQLINSIYDDFHPLTPIETDTFICFPFYIGNQPLIEIPNRDQLEQHLNQLLINENPVANLRIIRIMRLYESNVVYLIKPKKLRYWLQSVAIQDADETFADLVAQEYQL